MSFNSIPSQTNSDTIGKDGSFSMKILELFIQNKGKFVTNSEIGLKLGNHSRVSKITEYFFHKNIVSKFSDLTLQEKKEYEKIDIREIRTEGYRITILGEKKYENITKNCLEPISRKIIGK